MGHGPGLSAGTAQQRHAEVKGPLTGPPDGLRAAVVVVAVLLCSSPLEAEPGRSGEGPAGTSPFWVGSASSAAAMETAVGW